MEFEDLPIEKGLVSYKYQGFSLFAPKINRFATIVKIIHALKEGQSFNSRQIAKYLGRELFEHGETRYKDCVSHHATALRYLNRLSAQKYIQGGHSQYATFSNGGNGYRTFYKRHEFPELFIKQTLEIKNNQHLNYIT